MYRAWEYRNFYTDPFDLIPANPDEVTVRRNCRAAVTRILRRGRGLKRRKGVGLPTPYTE